MVTPDEVRRCMAAELPAIHQAVRGAYQRHPLFDRDFSFGRTRSNVRWNAMAEDLGDVFSRGSQLSAQRRGNSMNLWCFRASVPMRFRVKKMSPELRTSNVQTQAVLDFVEQSTQVLLPTEGMRSALNLFIGYIPNVLESDVERVVIALPAGRSAYEWVMDIDDDAQGDAGTFVSPIRPHSPNPGGTLFVAKSADSVVATSGTDD